MLLAVVVGKLGLAGSFGAIFLVFLFLGFVIARLCVFFVIFRHLVSILGILNREKIWDQVSLNINNRVNQK